ncbi:MAG TPA: FAD binding domain-containing protein, partial [Planctomycetaceae bacterium]|nr:FAD binding domain-containing protein [Planctomycetaceae bacterium]
ETEALELLAEPRGRTAVLAGGTDLVSLMQSDLVAPERVVDIRNIESMRGVMPAGDGIVIGALTTLDELLASPLLQAYQSIVQVADATHSIQMQAMGTLGGDLCLLPHCWYFRNGYGLLAMQNGESLVEAGDNRYHAIFGNRGPAMFVSASRFAPALISWGAKVRVIGPEPDRVETLPLEYFYRSPKSPNQGVTVLEPGQLVSHVWLPLAEGRQSASYEVLQIQGLDWPLAAASATLHIDGDVVQSARITLGHVAPTPWFSPEAALALIGQEVNEQTAEQAGAAAAAVATPLSHNGYKVQLAQTAVKRAILRAVGQLEI